MNNYEGVFILDPDLATDLSKGLVTQIEELVGKGGGRIDGIQDWGKKRLAYRIRKKNEGHYVVMNFQIDPKQVKRIDQTLRLNDSVMRYLIIHKEIKKQKPAGAR